jgi:hypothetical protein
MAAVVRTGARTPGAWLRIGALFVPGLMLAGAWQVTHSPHFVGPVHDLELGTFLSRFVWDRLRAETLWVRYYWMTWGWVDTALRDPYYRAIEGMLLVAAAGLVAGWPLLSRERRALAILGLGATAYGMIMLYAVEFKILRMTSMPFVQGRYLLPVFPLTAGALLVGLEGLSRRVGRLDLRWALPLLLLALDVASFARALTRYYGT